MKALCKCLNNNLIIFFMKWDFDVKCRCVTERQSDGSVWLELKMTVLCHCVLWGLDGFEWGRGTLGSWCFQR